jgi:hypothetical protein
MRIIAAFILLTTWATQAPAQVPNVLGWYSIPNTKIKPICPFTEAPTTYSSIQRVEGCDAVTLSWSTGAYDTVNNRLLLWGGGHDAYWGNELYALNMGDGTTAPTIKRLNNPTVPTATCTAAAAPGFPTSRHTQDQVVFVDHLNLLYNKGGANACGTGGLYQDAWQLDLTSLPTSCDAFGDPTPCVASWTQMTSTPNTSGNTFTMDYDPNTRLVWAMDDFGNLRTYDASTDTWLTRATTGLGTSGQNFRKNGIIDPVRRLFVIIGSGVVNVWDIGKATPTISTWTTTGATTMVSTIAPGLAYDRNTQTIVGWHGGNSVYRLNLDSKVWTQETYSVAAGFAENGPQLIASTAGTYKRFRYVPDQNLFVLCNDVDENCFALRTSLTETALNDFTERCSTFGVIKCVGFDSTGDIAPNGCAIDACWSTQPQGLGSGQGTWTLGTSIKASGNSALRMDIAQGQSGNATFFANFANDYGTRFGANQKFIISFRQYMGSGFVAIGNAGFKQVIISTGSTGTGVANSYGSCTDLEIVYQSAGNRGHMQMYSTCPSANTVNFDQNFGGDFKLQTGRASPFCLRSQAPGTGGASDGSDQYPPNGNCFQFRHNEWIAYKTIVTIGARSGSFWLGSNVKTYAAYDGEPWELVHDWTYGSMGGGFGALDHYAGTPTEDQKYGQVWFTARNPSGWPTSTFTLYDELIIASCTVNPSCDIAAPGLAGATSTPTSPSNLTVKQGP